MKIKWLAFTIILNIFIVLFVSILVEYNSLSSRLQTMENNVSVALETAIDTSMMSEEFFSEGFTSRYYSYALTSKANAQKLNNESEKAPSMDYSRLFIYRNGEWIAGNTYVMAYAFQQLGRFPESQTEINQYTNKFITGHGNTLAENASRASIFSWLYGSVGQWYTSNKLKKWSSINQNTIDEYESLNMGFGDKGGIVKDEETKYIKSGNTVVGAVNVDDTDPQYHQNGSVGTATGTRESTVESYKKSAKIRSLFNQSNTYTATANWDSSSQGLSPAPDFAQFYNTIGQLVLSRSPAKIHSEITTNLGTNAIESFKVKNVVYPTLWNMGLTFNGTQWVKYKGLKTEIREQMFEGFPTYDGLDTERNEIPTDTSDVMTDNWCASYHVGKQKVDSSGNVIGKKSIYMLTPMSLGVTYVPLKVMKPVFAANLENIIRFGRLKTRDNQGAMDINAKGGFEGANYDIGTKVFGVWDNTNDTVQNLHEWGGLYLGRSNGTRTDYITDGQVEYDMSSIKTKVDYFYIDFSDPKNYDIVNRCVGAKPIKSTSDTISKASETIDSLDTATKYYQNQADNLIGGQHKDVEKNYRIVAKITARIRVQVPYQAAIMQWSRKLINSIRGNTNHEHFGIRALYRGDNDAYTSRGYETDGSDGITIDEQSDGLWFEYTTYRAISR